ncbi:MAG: alcohol dehydrogenase catalytic domain-containing protein [Dehalococcoidia bacterium]
MQAAAWTADARLALETRPDPEPAPGETLVRVLSTGICGSDLHFFRGEFPPPVGIAPGHEIAGIVEGGDGLPPGTHVAVNPLLGCLTCGDCRNGNVHLCSGRILTGIGAAGGLQQLLAIRRDNVHELPTGVDPALGSLAEPVAVCLRAVHLAQLPQGACSLVLGAGTIGLMSLLLLRDQCTEVAITARYPHQREAALALGAAHVFEPGGPEVRQWAKSRRPDAVFETVGGHADTLKDAIMSVRAGGTVVALGVFTGPAQVPAFRLVNDEIRLVGSIMYGHSGRQTEFGQAVDLLAKYSADLPRFQTATYPLAAANEAFEHALDKSRNSLKITIRPNA